ncbi:MAG: hypothetical protein H9W81_07985 [Enterococcus sp.]|nr:hypothetical protein [Enterococcus sp.]
MLTGLLINKGKIMELPELPASVIAANVEELENLFLTSKKDFKWSSNRVIDEAIEILAKYGKSYTIAQMAEAEEVDTYCYEDSQVRRAMTELYAEWINPKTFITRDDNLLSREAKVEDSWQLRFKQAMVGMLLEKGQLMDYNANYYGWKAYEEITEEVIGVFNLKTDEWGEFQGTFASPNETYTGITAEVLYANGIFRNLRYEADIATMMREL